METQSNIEMEAQSNIEIELQSNIEMEAQSNIKIEVQSNVKYCKSCGQDHPLESFNNSKTCLKCRSKKNNQNAQKCVAANVNTGYGIIEDFLAVLRTIKGQKIENFKQIININEYITPIDPKEIATSISNNILTNINLNSNTTVHNLLIKSKKHEDPTKYRDHNVMVLPQWLVIWKNLGTKSPNIAEKQIYYWWINFSQHIWKKD
ncbi:25464_t:CDS:2 [Gigaspora rosea]|nr:25464_t:CDS:2 [Gigaspora rosea]